MSPRRESVELSCRGSRQRRSQVTPCSSRLLHAIAALAVASRRGPQAARRAVQALLDHGGVTVAGHTDLLVSELVSNAVTAGAVTLLPYGCREACGYRINPLLAPIDA